MNNNYATNNEIINWSLQFPAMACSSGTATLYATNSSVCSETQQYVLMASCPGVLALNGSNPLTKDKWCAACETHGFRPCTSSNDCPGSPPQAPQVPAVISIPKDCQCECELCKYPSNCTSSYYNSANNASCLATYSKCNLPATPSSSAALAWSPLGLVALLCLIFVTL